MVFYIVKKKKFSLPFALKFPNFRPKIRVFSKKKKKVFTSICFLISRFLCSLKKKSSLPFALKFPNFRSKIRVFSKKKSVVTSLPLETNAK